MITITLFIVQAHLVEFEPAAVLFHLISISGEKQREREGEEMKTWRRSSTDDGERL